MEASSGSPKWLDRIRSHDNLDPPDDLRRYSIRHSNFRAARNCPSSLRVDDDERLVITRWRTDRQRDRQTDNLAMPVYRALHACATLTRDKKYLGSSYDYVGLRRAVIRK